MAFCGFLKQSTAVDVLLGPFLDETDGKTARTALTITQPDIQLSKNGAAQAQKSAAQTLTHDAGGCYPANLSTTDTGTLGLLAVRVHESGALPVRQDYLVVPASVWDLFHSRGLAMLGLVAYGTAQGGTASTIQLAAATSFADDLLNGGTTAITGGTGAGQSRVGTDWVSSSDTETVSPDWTTTPDSTSEYSHFATPPAPTSVAGIPAVNVTHNAGNAITAAAGIQEVKVASIANNAMTAAAAAADLTTEIAAGVLTVAMTESYAADGAAPTLAQAIFAIQQFLQEKSVSSTTMTVKKLDGSTTAMTFTLNDATTPTSITRAS